MRKEDLRVIKTKISIKDSFIDLVKEKGYNKVSVTDIVKKANINRNTFYLHYEDKEDLIKTLISEATVKMDSFFQTVQFLKQTTFANISELQIRWGLRSILKIIEEEKVLFNTVLLDESLQGFLDQFFDSIKGNLVVLLQVHNPEASLVFEYAMSGIFSIMRQWLKNPSSSFSDIAKILAKLSYTNLQQFKDVNS